MLRKNYLTLLLVFSLSLIGSVEGFAQTAPTSGKIELKKADGTTEPVSGATVEVFRTDIKGKFPSDKTNKKGEFGFAGLPLGAIFTFSVSAPNIKPEIVPNIKAGMEKLVISVSEGDGKRWTEDEVRQALANPAANSNATAPATGSNTTAPAANSNSSSNQPKGELTAEQKKAQAEYEAKAKEVTAKNEKITQSNELIKKALVEGNTAYDSKNYDLALAKYTEGIDASPDFVGTAPVLLNNKGAALTGRAVSTFNITVKSTDQAAKVEGMGKVKKDLADAADAYNRSWTISKSAQPTDITDPKNYEANKLNALRGAKETFRLMAATEQVDATKTEIGKTLIPEYVTLETDAVKKGEAQITLGDVFRVAGDFDNATVEYKKALELSKDNPDALAGLGLSLFASGEATNSTEKKQEGLNYMQRFTEVAPANHKLKNDVASVVEYLKSQKLAPQKVTTKKKN